MQAGGSFFLCIYECNEYRAEGEVHETRSDRECNEYRAEGEVHETRSDRECNEYRAEGNLIYCRGRKNIQIRKDSSEAFVRTNTLTATAGANSHRSWSKKCV